ncbi:MAG TPA: STAS/SEC14 domain-containing protein [Vicinamibacterales bacterium]|nr:STAS/SEC14 domain-containing protein [Vicinamibacterales bacterium]
MLRALEDSADRVIALKLSGKLHDEDYDRFVPLVEQAIATKGKTRMLLVFEDFHGWNPHALWDDIAFEAAHNDRIERIAMVGDTEWRPWMDKVSGSFSNATVRHFASDAEAEAWQWLSG